MNYLLNHTRFILVFLFISWSLNAQVALPTFHGVQATPKGLYSFSSHTFTNCGATGKTGPTLSNCKSSYDVSWEDDTDLFNMTTQGIQEWTVPITGSYTITVRGASGGEHSAGTAKKFGTGAIMIGTFSLNQEEVLSILVGQQGNANSGGEWCGCGGGGGSFVVKKSGNTSLIVSAGGAGGDGSGSYPDRPKPGGSSATGDATQAGTATQSGSKSSGAGGGFTYDGQDGEGGGGESFLNGGVGGTCIYGADVAHGGFGGGGAGTWWSVGGAAGGYQGGSTIAGYANDNGITAAKSYNNGSGQNNSSGTTTTSSNSKLHGQVIITLN
tara:strand:+ start:138 stop:1115 length:978 start_codon:yes stop_codon:yes gene_type:complete